jgi:DNA-binding FadR family transcriptional regulator
MYRGSGVVAGEPGPPAGESRADIAETTSPLELNIVRTIVEPEIVRLAIINMSARDISNVRAIVDKMAGVTTSAADFAALDEQFHLALAEGAHNTLLTAIYRLINDVRRHAHWEATREKTLSPNRIRDYQKLYRSICSAVEARDVESAVEFVKLVMVEIQRDLTLEA